MKNRVLIILMVIIALTAGIFCALWQSTAHDRSELKTLAQSNAAEAYERFSDFQNRGDDSDYWGGVAAFRVFQQSYTVLSDGENQTNRTWSEEIYGLLLLSPEEMKPHISDCAEIMQMLSEDITNENAFLRMSQLCNTIEHAE